MPNLTVLSGSPAVSMTSLELVALINSLREDGKPELRHTHFLAKIERHPGIDSAKFLAEYQDGSGRLCKCYRLPKRECTLLVMSESLEVQTQVYDKLEAMEKKAAPAPLSPMEMVIASAQAILRMEQEAAATQQRVTQLEGSMKLMSSATGYQTITAFLKTRGATLPLAVANALGKKCAAKCKLLGMQVGKVPDERFGSVNSYPVEVIEETYNERE